MESDTNGFELSDSGKHLRLTILKQSHPNASDNWDKNWLDVRIEVKSGSFSGAFNGTFFTTDFESFKQQLKPVYKSLKGSAVFVCTDGFVKAELSGDGLGHFIVKCEVIESYEPLSKLLFEMEIDQSYLPTVFNQLNLMTKEYPIIGEISSLRNEYNNLC